MFDYHSITVVYVRYNPLSIHSISMSELFVGWIPVSLANAPQCDIIMNEVNGVRKAMKNTYTK
jgi:hypothetical protein